MFTKQVFQSLRDVKARVDAKLIMLVLAHTHTHTHTYTHTKDENSDTVKLS